MINIFKSKKMPLQNRVNPFGILIATPQRGAWTGNRGVIHNDKQEIIRNYAVKYWITCELKYKNFQRKVMTPKRWTELFFLDEATAFAAGHRPCGFCRHADFKQFKQLWLLANGQRYGLEKDAKIDVIDALIHQERLDENGLKKTFKAVLSTLPDGTFVMLNQYSEAYLWHQKTLYQWSFSGYTKVSEFAQNQEVCVLTPLSYVAVFRAGYLPEIHESISDILC
jgi:methylphosphotriester-DNA--protein-cysteine methyltransferase